MRVTTFEIDYKNIDDMDKETSLFVLNNFLRFQFTLETIMPKYFHDYKEIINNSIMFLSRVYDGVIELEDKDHKLRFREIIILNHKDLEELTNNTKINEDNFTKWLRNRRNQ